MRKYIKYIFVVTILILIFKGYTSQPVKRISRSLGVEIPLNSEIEYKDTHGGFHGDGETLAKVIFNDSNSENILSQIVNSRDWNDLPMTENLNLIMYGGEKNGITYEYRFVEYHFGISYIENGYWFFKDRHSQSTSRNDDADLLNRYSFNFTIAIYDTDNNILYYLENDT